MPEYQVSLTQTAQRQLDKLPDSIATPILDAIAKLAKEPRPSGCKKLQGRPGYRIRKGDYRILYEIVDKKLVVTVISIGHRKDVYE